LLQAPHGVLQFTEADGGGPHDERAVCDSLGDSLELFGTGEQRSGADCRARLAKSHLIGVQYAEMEVSEVAHGTGCGADVERIARIDEYDAQAVEFGVRRQGRRVYRRREINELER